MTAEAAVLVLILADRSRGRTVAKRDCPHRESSNGCLFRGRAPYADMKRRGFVCAQDPEATIVMIAEAADLVLILADPYTARFNAVELTVMGKVQTAPFRCLEKLCWG